jgi:heme-degrading monooxygenase HmoA
MGVKENPPSGLIVHTHYEQDGQVHVLDVWESTDAHKNFAQQRLGPAVQAVTERNGVPAADAPEISVTEVHALVRGR